MWGGRFSGKLDNVVKRLNNSLSFDQRLWREDISGSTAYAGALLRAGVLSNQECQEIQGALTTIAEELESGALGLPHKAEDIHSAVEELLREKVGALAGKLHTGRSRNDQVATDMRMHVRGAIDSLLVHIRSVQSALIGLAEQEIDTIMPGYTHLQHAQPVLLAHHLLAYFWMLQRDRERLAEVRKRANVLPLGSGALAGSTAPLDRAALAEALGFEKISENSMDAVSDRDYLIEFLNACSILAMHFSRFAEEIILWNSSEFGFIDLSDAVTTGSSMMPQKKNPDVAELARGKSGRIYGHLIGLLTLLKGLPLTYNKDLQEDKEGVFDTIDTLEALLPAFELMLSSAKFNRGRMLEAASRDFSTATDLADVLVKQGMPFREAHEVMGHIVSDCVKAGKALEDLSCEELRSYHAALSCAPRGEAALGASIKARQLAGGTGPNAVLHQVKEAKERLKDTLSA